MAPPYVDENPNLEMIEQGLRVAENERRDAVTDEYESEAMEDGEDYGSLDDISYPQGNPDERDPELSAIKEHYPPASE